MQIQPNLFCSKEQADGIASVQQWIEAMLVKCEAVRPKLKSPITDNKLVFRGIKLSISINQKTKQLSLLIFQRKQLIQEIIAPDIVYEQYKAANTSTSAITNACAWASIKRRRRK